MKNQVQEGAHMQYVVPDGKVVQSGAAVVVGTQVGVAQCNGVGGEVVVLSVEGVYAFPKGTAAIAQGAAVYANVDGTSGAVTMVGTASGNTYTGVAWQAAAAGDATVVVKLK